MNRFCVFIAILVTVLTLSCTLNDKNGQNTTSAAVSSVASSSQEGFNSSTSSAAQSHSITYGMAFPPVGNDSEIEFSRTNLNELGVKHIRLSEQWALREASQGVFNWTPLDKRINWVTNSGMSLMLTIEANGPVWANSDISNAGSAVFKNDTDFTNYLTLLFQRYSGLIDKAQFGNEWQTTYWYAGSHGDFVHFHNLFYQVVKAHSPTTQVVLGGFSIGSLKILAAYYGKIQEFYDSDGYFYSSNTIQNFFATNTDLITRSLYVLSNAQYDLLDIHLYDDETNWQIYADVISNLMPSKPVIVSEFGGPNTLLEPYTEAYQALKLADYLQKINTLNVSEAYYFTLVETPSAHKSHTNSGLFTGLPARKQAFEVYKNH